MTSGSARTARKTVLLVASVAALLSLWSYYRHRLLTAEFAGCITILLLITLLRSTWTQRFHSAWMALAAALGYVNSRILLGLFYVIAIVPIGLLMRLLGFDPLVRHGKRQPSYWVPRTEIRQTKEQFKLTF